MKTTLLIDGDILVYRAAAAAETSVEWDDGVFSNAGDFHAARRSVDDTIEYWQRRLNADDVFVLLSDPKRNWRKQVYQEYKANRTGMKPTVFRALREHVQNHYRSEWLPFLEADDLMGMYATGTKIAGKRIIVSADKDMRTVPGYLFNPGKQDAGVTLISRADADRAHMTQALTGDATDNYPGCPGIGKVRAERVLAGATGRDLWKAVKAAFRAAGLAEKQALEQARVARILRAGEYSKKTNKVRLWTPSMLEIDE